MSNTATFTATANSSTTIGYARYGSTSWNTGTSNGACQGAYQGTTASMSRVGVMVFSGAGAALQGKVISEIALKMVASASGTAGSKTLTFHKAVTQSLITSVAGSAQVGDTLGTLTGKFYSNTATHTLNASTNPALFAALKAYLEAGNSAVVLYNGETSSSTGWSTNYARITSCTMTVTYEEGKSTGKITVGTYGADSVPVSVAISANSAAYSHKVTFKLGSNTTAVSVAAGGTTASYTASYAYLPSAVSGTLTVTIETLNGTTSYGSNSYTAAISIPASVAPSIGSVTATPVYAGDVSAAAQGWGLYIQGKTKVTVAMSGVAAGSGSSIASYSIANSSIGSGTGSSYTSGTLNGSGSFTFTCKVTDARGRTASKTVSITVYAYAGPTIGSYSLYRCDSEGVRADTDGTYARLQAAFNCSSVNGKNAVTAQATVNAVTTQISSGTAYTLGAGELAVDVSYPLKIVLTDTVGSAVTISLSVPSAAYLLHFRKGGKSIGIGRAAGTTDDKTVHVGWGTVLDNALSAALLNVRSPASVYPTLYFKEPGASNLPNDGTNAGAVTVSTDLHRLALANFCTDTDYYEQFFTPTPDTERTANGYFSLLTTKAAVTVAQGGTGATTVAGARNALGLGNTSGALPIANGGTGATTAAAARTNLGVKAISFGSIALSSSAMVASGTSASYTGTVTVPSGAAVSITGATSTNIYSCVSGTPGVSVSGTTATFTLPLYNISTGTHTVAGRIYYAILT